MFNNHKRKRVVLSIQQKLDIIEKLEKGKSASSLSSEYNIGDSTVRELMKKKDELLKFTSCVESSSALKNRKTLKKASYENLDKAMLDWFSQQRSLGKPVSGVICAEKAKFFFEALGIKGKFQSSYSWLHRFKKRHGIGELDIQSKDASEKAAVSTSIAPAEASASISTKPTLHQRMSADEVGSASQSPVRDISHLNLEEEVKLEDEDTYLEEMHTEENMHTDDEELSSTAQKEQMFPEITKPGCVMQDTYELFGRYMTSILRQLPVVTSYSLQQQFISVAIDAKLEYERQHPSKSPQRNCFSPLPQAPVYPVINAETTEKLPAKKGRKKRKNNPAEEESPAIMLEHVTLPNIKQEVIDYIESSDFNGEETTVGSILEGCHSEIDFEEDPEFKPEVKDPFEVVVCRDPLETAKSSRNTKRRYGRRKLCNGKSSTESKNQPTDTARKQIRLTEYNQVSPTCSVPSTQNPPRLLSNTLTVSPAKSHPQPFQTIQLPPSQNSPSLLLLTLTQSRSLPQDPFGSSNT